MDQNIVNADELVSIIMPAYNSEKYIGDSIRSVLKQTYENWELIVIDDGSRDKTIEIIEKFVSKDIRVKFYKNESNLGVSQTRNKAIALAAGEWIAFLDSDDIWESNKLELQLVHSKKYNSEFIFSGSSYIDENNNAYNGIFEVPNNVNFKELLKHNVISCSSVIIKSNILKNYKMDNDNMHEDFALWLQILNNNYIAYGINKPLLIYRIYKNSKSGNKFKSIFMTYRVFEFLNIGKFKSIHYTCSHLISAFKKYKKIESPKITE